MSPRRGDLDRHLAAVVDGDHAGVHGGRADRRVIGVDVRAPDAVGPVLVGGRAVVREFLADFRAMLDGVHPPRVDGRIARGGMSLASDRRPLPQSSTRGSGLSGRGSGVSRPARCRRPAAGGRRAGAAVAFASVMPELRARSSAAEVRLALLQEGGHALLLVLRREEQVEEAPLVRQRVGQAHLVGRIDRLLRHPQRDR